MVLGLDGVAAHAYRYRPREVDAVVTRRSDAFQHRRFGTLDGEDVEMLVDDDAARSRMLQSCCLPLVAAQGRGRVVSRDADG